MRLLPTTDQIAQWKKQALDELPQIFSSGRSEQKQSDEALTNTLYQQIGQLKVQLDWLKKNQVSSLEQKRRLIEPGHPEVTIAEQCDLLGLARSSYYYQAVGETEENLHLMRLLDEQYTKTPYYGILKMTAWLKTQGYWGNEKRVARLLRLMGLEAVYPKPRLSLPDPTAHHYPYLLRGVTIERVNHVWSTDVRRVGACEIPVRHRRGREKIPLGQWLTYHRKMKGTVACQ